MKNWPYNLQFWFSTNTLYLWTVVAGLNPSQFFPLCEHQPSAGGNIDSLAAGKNRDGGLLCRCREVSDCKQCLMTTWCIVSKKWQQPFCYVHVNTEMGIRTYNHGKTKAINTGQVLSSKKLANLTWSTLCGVWSKMDNLKWSVAAKKCLSAKMSTVNSVAFLCQLLRQLQPPSRHV